VLSRPYITVNPENEWTIIQNGSLRKKVGYDDLKSIFLDKPYVRPIYDTYYDPWLHDDGTSVDDKIWRWDVVEDNIRYFVESIEQAKSAINKDELNIFKEFIKTHTKYKIYDTELEVGERPGVSFTRAEQSNASVSGRYAELFEGTSA
jgi:hypothetical protein